jgi:hypothetical protein
VFPAKNNCCPQLHLLKLSLLHRLKAQKQKGFLLKDEIKIQEKGRKTKDPKTDIVTFHPHCSSFPKGGFGNVFIASFHNEFIPFLVSMCLGFNVSNDRKDKKKKTENIIITLALCNRSYDIKKEIWARALERDTDLL